MTTAEMNRLRWHCRRGLLENDLVLERFLDRHGAELDGERLQTFRNLLELGDHDLWALLSGCEDCGDPALGELVQLLRRC